MHSPSTEFYTTRFCGGALTCWQPEQIRSLEARFPFCSHWLPFTILILFFRILDNSQVTSYLLYSQNKPLTFWLSHQFSSLLKKPTNIRKTANFWTSGHFSPGKQPYLVLGVLLPLDLSKFPENRMLLALEEWLNRGMVFTQNSTKGALGGWELLPCQAPPWKEGFPWLTVIWKEFESAAIVEIRCHHRLDLFACIWPWSPAPVRQQLLLPSKAQLFLPSHPILCPELPSSTAGIEGCLKSLFERGHSSGNAHLLLHPTFILVSTEGMNLGGLTFSTWAHFIGLLVHSQSFAAGL